MTVRTEFSDRLLVFSQFMFESLDQLHGGRIETVEKGECVRAAFHERECREELLDLAVLRRSIQEKDPDRATVGTAIVVTGRTEDEVTYTITINVDKGRGADPKLIQAG